MILWGGWRDISFGVEVFPGSDARCIETREGSPMVGPVSNRVYGEPHSVGQERRILPVRARASPNYGLLGFFRSGSGEPELWSLGPARGTRLRRDKLPQNLSHGCAGSRGKVACLSM